MEIICNLDSAIVSLCYYNTNPNLNSQLCGPVVSSRSVAFVGCFFFFKLIGFLIGLLIGGAHLGMSWPHGEQGGAAGGPRNHGITDQ